MKTLQTLTLVSAMATLAIASPAVALTTFTNNFESGGYAGTGFETLGAYEGWTASSGFIEVQHGNVAGLSHSGTHHVELDSTTNSSMTRSIDQGLYTLSFFYSNRPNVVAASNGINVLLNNVIILTIPGALGGAGTAWTQYDINFDAALGGPNALTFSATGTSDSFGGYLDDISLQASAIPEPASWAMMVIGLGIVGGALRRRATRLSFS